jgi:hypothetical protein
LSPKTLNKCKNQKAIICLVKDRIIIFGIQNPLELSSQLTWDPRSTTKKETN